MKKFGLRLLLTSVTFVVGINVPPLCSRISPERVSICELAANPSRYQGKIVIVKGAASAWETGFLLGDDSCRQEVARIIFVNAEAETSTIRAFHEQLLSENDWRNRPEAEAVVVGRVEASSGNEPRLEIDASQIRQVAPIYYVSLRRD